jgi:hypothetical protein
VEGGGGGSVRQSGVKTKILKLNKTCTWSDATIILFLVFLITSFGLNRPSSGQYLQKKKNLKMLVHKVIICAPPFLNILKFFFCKYWPDDGLFRSKLVTKNTKIKR